MPPLCPPAQSSWGSVGESSICCHPCDPLAAPKYHPINLLQVWSDQEAPLPSLWLLPPQGKTHVATSPDTGAGLQCPRSSWDCPGPLRASHLRIFFPLLSQRSRLGPRPIQEEGPCAPRAPHIPLAGTLVAGARRNVQQLSVLAPNPWHSHTAGLKWPLSQTAL